MLAYFIAKRQWHQLTMTLHVDNERQEAELTITYAKRIVRTGDRRDVAHRDVMTPEKAEAWMVRPIKVGDGTMSMVEYLEGFYKRHAARIAAEGDDQS